MSKSNPIPFSQEYLTTILHYCHESGLLSWKERPASMFNSAGHAERWNKQCANKNIDCINNAGYKVIRLSKRNYLVHRIIWLLYHGYDATVIDHIDRDKTNNSIINLRNTSQAENCRNQSKRPTNKSGITGVCYNKNRNTWLIQINLKSGKKFSRNLKCLFEACCLRKSLELQNGYISPD